MGHASADLTTDFLLEAPAEATHQFAGTLFVALFSALFWTGLLAAIGVAVGHPPGTLLLMAVGTAIAGFLAAVVQCCWEGRGPTSVPPQRGDVASLNPEYRLALSRGMATHS